MDINDIGSLIGGTMARIKKAQTPEEKELLKKALNYFSAARQVNAFGHPQLARSLMAFGERTILQITMKDISGEPWPADVVQVMPWLDRDKTYPARPKRPHAPMRNYLYSLYDRMEDRIARFTDGIEDWMDRTFQTVRPRTALDRLIFDLSGKNVQGGPPQKITSQGVNKATSVVMNMLRRPMPPEQKAILKDALANLTLSRSLLDMGLPEYARIFVAIAEMRVCNISPEVAQRTGYTPNPVLRGVHVPDVVVPDEPAEPAPKKAPKAKAPAKPKAPAKVKAPAPAPAAPEAPAKPRAPARPRARKPS